MLMIALADGQSSGQGAESMVLMALAKGFRERARDTKMLGLLM